MELKDLQHGAVIIASLLGAVVAVIGLSTWRKQLHGRQEYEVAFRLLTLAYRYREVLQGVRSPRAAL